MADLPEVGLQAVLEGVAEFERGAKVIADAMRMVASESQTLAKESEQAAETTTSAWQNMAQLMGLGALQQVSGTIGQVGNQLIGLAKQLRDQLGWDWLIWIGHFYPYQLAIMLGGAMLMLAAIVKFLARLSRAEDKACAEW